LRIEGWNTLRDGTPKIVGASLAVALIFSIAIGCGGWLQHNHRDQRDNRAGASPAPTPTIEPINEHELKQVLAQLQGKVVLVNFWATWCPPCVAEFPSLVRLDNKYSSEGLEIIAVSFDDKSQLNAQVLPFVKSQKARFKVYLKDVEDIEKFINSIDENWVGAIPATFVFDRNGTLIKSVIGEQTFENFESLIRPFL
jgi:thiol-disulfide isomerase/thioredoxin